MMQDTNWWWWWFIFSRLFFRNNRSKPLSIEPLESQAYFTCIHWYHGLAYIIILTLTMMGLCILPWILPSITFTANPSAYLATNLASTIAVNTAPIIPLAATTKTTLTATNNLVNTQPLLNNNLIIPTRQIPILTTQQQFNNIQQSNIGVDTRCNPYQTFMSCNNKYSYPLKTSIYYQNNGLILGSSCDAICLLNENYNSGVDNFEEINMGTCYCTK